MEAVRRFSGTRLRECRQRRGVTIDALAEAVGTTRPNLIAYEKGRRLPSPSTVQVLADALRVRPHEFADAPRNQWALEDLRVFSGWTKTAAAAALGVPRATYDAMEAGRRRLRDDLFEPLAALLDRSPAVLRAAYRRTLAARG